MGCPLYLKQEKSPLWDAEMAVKMDARDTVHVIVCMSVRIIAQEHAKDAKEVAEVIVLATVKRPAKVVAKTHVVVVALIHAQEAQNNRECRKPYRVGENL